MSDIALMLEEIRNKLDEHEMRLNELNKKINGIKTYPQMVWGDDSMPPKVFEPMEIKDPVPNPYEIKCEGE